MCVSITYPWLSMSIWKLALVTRRWWILPWAHRSSTSNGCMCVRQEEMGVPDVLYNTDVCMYYISWPERDDCLILFVISHGFCNNYLKGRQELHRNNPHHFHLLSQWQSHHIPAPTWQANMEIWVMSLKNNTQKVQLQNASNIKGRMMPQRCCMPVCCIFSEPNWNKSILLALHVFQARLWCICLGICAWCKGIGRFQGIVSGKKSLETDDFVIWVYECWI